MTLVSLLITLLVLGGVVAILWWAYKEFDLPKPFRILVVILIAVIAITVLLRFVPSLGSYRL